MLCARARVFVFVHLTIAVNITTIKSDDYANKMKKRLFV